ncbi:c-type cytochrome [Rhodovulum adriaticum]|uniref:Cytochrome c556 n=1 Tax=Rhodovulum adriaticum TaxID=35804 RepID=A0A4R2NTS3_RHOAD|nr:cytochrome c [Rhodovulum adriaticum]MBK1635964.1 cytochrome C [Rhodovulum adriaticum]TCP25423.1 cytochrome c556 [Rhodovulum adriaticum]
MRKVLLTALVAAIPATGFAAGLEDLVEARRGYYKLLGANMGTLSAMAKGDVAYDGAAAQTAADNLKTLTQYNVGHLYAPGTSKADMPGKTRALPAIWEDQAGVAEKGMAYVEAVNALAEVAGLDRADMGKALQKVGGTCKGCHDDYRAKDF